MLFHSYPDPSAGQKRALMAPLAFDNVEPSWPTDTEVVRWRLFGDELIQTNVSSQRERHWNLTRNRELEIGEGQLRREILRLHGEATTRFTLIIQPDQWTLYPAMRKQLPAYRIELNDGRVWYVSQQTGQTIQYATRSQRLWAWLGLIPHWLYPRVLVQYRQAWRYVILVIATIGMVTMATGLLVGLRSLRQRRSPFASATLRIHHWLGLGFGVVTWTWLFSGALSLNPFHWSSGTSVANLEMTTIASVPSSVELVTTPMMALAQCNASGLVIRELELRIMAGSPAYFCHHDDGTRVLPANGEHVESNSDVVTSKLQQLGLTAVSVHRVTQSDGYFYSSLHGGLVGDAFRAELDDGRTLYLSAHDGQPLACYGDSAKAERWLYHGLHSFDVSWLRSRQWLRLSLMLLLLTGGLMLCATGIVGFARWANRSKER